MALLNNEISIDSESKKPITKVPTQICGLDKVLERGFPFGRTTMVGGGPGTGKTVLAMEFLFIKSKAPIILSITINGRLRAMALSSICKQNKSNEPITLENHQ